MPPSSASPFRHSVGSAWIAVIGRIIATAGFPVAFAAMASSFAAAAVIIAVALRGEPLSPAMSVAEDPE